MTPSEMLANLERLSAEEPRKGRPPKQLPPHVVHAVQNALKKRSFRSVASAVGCSESWLRMVYHDGRLAQMGDSDM